MKLAVPATFLAMLLGLLIASAARLPAHVSLALASGRLPAFGADLAIAASGALMMV